MGTKTNVPEGTARIFCPRWALTSSLKLDNEGELSRNSLESTSFHSFNKIHKIYEYSVLKIAKFPEIQLTNMKNDQGFILGI